MVGIGLSIPVLASRARFGAAAVPSSPPPEIAITNGRGVAGSTYTVTNGGTGNWQIDQANIAGETGRTTVLSLANEGKGLRWLRSDGVASNVIEMWVPQTDLPGVALVCDPRQGRTPATAGPVMVWASTVGLHEFTQATAANQPVYSTDRFGQGSGGFAFDETDFWDGVNVNIATPSRSVLALMRMTNANSNRTIIGGTLNGEFAFRRDANARMQLVSSGIAVLAADGPIAPSGSTILVAGRITQRGPFEFQQNGKVTATGTASNNDIGTSAVQQIGRAVTSQMFLGDLGVIIETGTNADPADWERAHGWAAAISNHALDPAHPFAMLAPRVR